MRIGINLLYLLPGIVGGTQTYAQELLQALALQDRDNHYTLFVNAESHDLPLPDVSNFERVICPVQASSRSARYRYEQLALPGQLRVRRIDLLHSMGYIGPLVTPCKHIVTIHDLIYVGFKDAMSLKRRLVLQFFVRNTARRAHHIVTDSESSKKQIIVDTGVPPDKVTMIYAAGKTHAACVLSEADQTRMLDKYGIRTPYLIAFSSLSLSKNIPRLVEAVAQIRSAVPHQLVLVGHVPPEANLAQQIKALNLEASTIITGYVPDEHVLPLIAHADLFVFPSWYEGFGLPALDAQQVGVPLACSNAASLPEVAGEGAVYFDPYSVDAMAAAIRAGLTDQALRARLKEQGLANVHRFSWEETAQQMLALYRRVGEPACHDAQNRS